MQNDLPIRKNIRLKGYDYSSNGMYFITICCENRNNFFGKICRGGALLHPIIELSNIGEIISEQWYGLKNRFQNILLDQFVVMPNHIHGIIIIDNERADTVPERVEQSPIPIGNIICAYKSITTKLLNKYDNLPGRIIWQRNYYDHIIHDENELQRIRQYITDNLAKWHEDEYFT
jgi:REP element-mobilizing transposase RayT